VFFDPQQGLNRDAGKRGKRLGNSGGLAAVPDEAGKVGDVSMGRDGEAVAEIIPKDA
jgi:hypothetical protein